MRMVIALDEDGVRGRNIVPGGQSGLTDSEHFADQAALWLGNQTIPLRFHVDQVVEGATGREVLEP
ncbi:MAG: penicillin acylase family protein [Myxococcota bacterium]